MEQLAKEVVLVIGSGGREHALAWKLAQQQHHHQQQQQQQQRQLVRAIFVAPGNAGCSNPEANITCLGKQRFSMLAAAHIEVSELDVSNFDAVGAFCMEKCVTLVVVGPEQPLADGIVDRLAVLCPTLPVFGPKKAAAQLETSKAFSKEFMRRFGLPTARYQVFTRADEACSHIMGCSYPALVVKASGLCAGKGVVVAETREEACQAATTMLQDGQFGEAGSEIVVEELLQGEEVSALCFTDGTTVSLMPIAQDHKRLLADDRGPNTGGMGAFAPHPLIGDQTRADIQRIMQKAVNSIRSMGICYTGVLYGGFMLTGDGPMLLEFNCRFGDPETQALMPLMETDLYSVMVACARDTLHEIDVRWREGAVACGVVLASAGYPGAYEKGVPIEGLDRLGTPTSTRISDAMVFHAGTSFDRQQPKRVVTSGGRVLCCVGVATDLRSARDIAVRAAESVHFPGKQYRGDIGSAVLKRVNERCSKNGSSSVTNGVSYADAGVSISEGNRLVQLIKESCRRTQRLRTGSEQIGGFGAVFDLKAAGFSDPLLVMGMDGVGTKLAVADACRDFSSIGQDLVAMCANDVLCEGAEPLAFLDYYVTGKLNADRAASVVKSIADACVEAGCALVGGETAEMPGVYEPDQWDLAGCVIGAKERNWPKLPQVDRIAPGDLIVGLMSSGLHSNGFSLVRKIVESSGLSYNDPCPWDKGRSFGCCLLTPTKLYVRSLLDAVKCGRVKALAHITGGGLLENIPRVLPKNCGAVLDATSWNMPEVFQWLHHAGPASATEMSRAFNCGLGMTVVVDSACANALVESLTAHGEKCAIVGRVVFNDVVSGSPVIVENMERALAPSSHLQLPSMLPSPRKVNVGILISGAGSNMCKLIERSLRPASICRVAVVVSNVGTAGGIAIARKFGIRTEIITSKGLERSEFEAKVSALLRSCEVELVCLAGFMRILTDGFVSEWRGRLLNTHPSLLPSFKGKDAVPQALRSGARYTGCTVHFVETEVDSGAIVEQAAVRIEPGDTEESLHERIKREEHKIFPLAMEMVASGKVRRGDDGTTAVFA